MKITSSPGLVLAAGALALLAGCSGGTAETPRSAPGSSAPPYSALPPTPSEEPPPGPSTPPTTGTTSPPAQRKPVIGAVWTTPRLRCQPVCTLTPAAGTITFHAEVSAATRVEFFLVPTGTDTWASRRSIGVDRSGEDGWSVRHTYADEPLWSHLVVVAGGPGGTTEKLPFNLYHADPR